MKICVCLVLVVYVFCYVQTSGSHFSIDKVHLIDYNITTNTFLLRGNLPITQDPSTQQRQFMNLTLFLQQASQRVWNESRVQIPTPSSFQFVDVSFLNDIVEHKDVEMEKDFFTQHPSQGQFIQWPIYGFPINASSLNSWERGEILKTHLWDAKDHLLTRIPLLHEMVHGNKIQRNGQLNIIYIHCEAGTDRTGQVSGAYYMQYLNWSYEKTLTFDYQYRPIAAMSEKALNWYCWHLFYQLAKQDLHCQFTIPHSK